MPLQPPVSASDHSQGPENAPVTLVEYGDYQCPYCGEAFPVVRGLGERFGDDLRLVFRNFPLTDLHPEALRAAVCAEFAGEHGKFWPVHDALYENQDQLGPDLYRQILQQVGLDPDGPSEDDRQKLVERIQADLDSGLRSGVNGTPSFFVNGEFVALQGGFDELATVVEQAIAERRG